MPQLRAGGEPKCAVTLFAYDDYFPAVATTDLLCRVADVLCCKARTPSTQLYATSCYKLSPRRSTHPGSLLAPQPSELAFYPIPKLMIRRVGDHEARYTRDAREVGLRCTVDAQCLKHRWRRGGRRTLRFGRRSSATALSSCARCSNLHNETR